MTAINTARIACGVGLLAALFGLLDASGARQGVDVRSVYELSESETVFAYSRISADGDLLTYTSQPRGTGEGVHWRIKLIRLSTGRELFSDTGFDGYFSPDGKRLIYRAVKGDRQTVVVRDIGAERAIEDVAPVELGDYYSWGKRDASDMVLTVRGHYFFLDRLGRGIMPANTMRHCPELGPAERPLISKDGKLVTAFVYGTVVVRPIDACEPIIRTGLRGAKADFSYDSRYIAMHAPSRSGARYDVFVVDLANGDVRNVTRELPGSSFYPSWTRGGRLSFRYDGSDYQGFKIASGFLNLPPLRQALGLSLDPSVVRWHDVFEGSSVPEQPLALVVVWGTWNVHGAEALLEVGRSFGAESASSLALRMATDSISSERLVAEALRACACAVERIQLRSAGLPLTWMNNQNPALLLFRSGFLIDRRLGVQKTSELSAWIRLAANGQLPDPKVTTRLNNAEAHIGGARLGFVN